MNAQDKLIFAAALLLAMLSVAQADETELHVFIENYKHYIQIYGLKQDDMTAVKNFGTMVAENHVKNFREIMMSDEKITFDFVKELRAKLYYPNVKEYDNNEDIRAKAAENYPIVKEYDYHRAILAAENYFNKVDVENIVKEFSKNELSSRRLNGKSKIFIELLRESVEGPCKRFYIGRGIFLDTFKLYVEEEDFANALKEHDAKHELKQLILDFALHLVCIQTRDYLLYAPVFEEPLKSDLHRYIKEYEIYSVLHPKLNMRVVERFGAMVAENHVENFKEIFSDRITADFVETLRAKLYYPNVEEYNNNEDIRVWAAENYFNDVDIENIVKVFDTENELSYHGLIGKLKIFVKLLREFVEQPCDYYLRNFKTFFDPFNKYAASWELVADVEDYGAEDEVKKLIRNWALYLVCRRTEDFFSLRKRILDDLWKTFESR